MSVFTVHQPPLRTGEALPDSEHFVFVRDGFSFWAFIVSWLWMLWHQMWLVFVGYVVGVAAIMAALSLLGASHAAMVVVGLLISILVGLEASTLRRFSLRRQGWNNVGIVCGDNLEDAERRFFAAWLSGKSAQQPASVAAAPPPVNPPPANPSAALPRATDLPGVVGLFPEPGAPR